MHPDELVFGLLAQGHATLCYDGQNFFDTDHPTKDKDGNIVMASNYDDGASTPGPGWYLLDTTRQVRPVIWQEREKYEFTTVTRADDATVFMTDEYKYGIRARVNAGFGLWQLGYCSYGALTVENYEAARKQMMTLRGDQGRVCPPEAWPERGPAKGVTRSSQRPCAAARTGSRRASYRGRHKHRRRR